MNSAMAPKKPSKPSIFGGRTSAGIVIAKSDVSANPEEKLKGELAAFWSLLSAKGKLRESEIKEKIRFKDKTWRLFSLRFWKKGRMCE